uniref:MULE transposase domain-containing protein n=1 Tax=Schizaphis graminum TaxID=13262 RepID=A0A2S2PMI1_SCHGA
MSCVIKCVATIHNKVMLNVNNYEFMLNKQITRKRDNTKVYYWICSKKCGVTFRTIVVNNEHIKDNSCILKEHSHGPDPIKTECKKIKENIKKAAKDHKDPHKIYQEQISGAPLIISSQITKNMSKLLIKRQRKGKLTEPCSLRDLNLPPELRKTLSGQEFYIKDIGSDTDKIIILSTIENLRYLSESQFWLADGTFKSCPGLFKQIYTIHGNIKKGNGTICVPLVFSLMVKQTENAYRTMFLELNNFALENDIHLTRNFNLEIITDFEKAAINAINYVFPSAFHSACFFHFSQNIYRHIQKEGLATKYIEDFNFNLLCRHLPALAFLPITKVIEGWEKIKPLFSNDDREQKLLEYFESTYIGKPFMRLRGQTRKPPMFSSELWSVAASVEVELPRTVTLLNHGTVA